ncbi:putative permease [Spongiibacter sp. IMCC21906]|jgi:putative permease|uniref:AI-2E family transporter n=1 Tax=Spongiibacter sp. IMCC21906 TaxID=1620392 RepID=UPI00062E0218|nr:AI-2E family transporter [Spongiibacter sp. IMCC21906]AKH70327.1 putative permease [Spongiibacter sp. IMCC21906]
MLATFRSWFDRLFAEEETVVLLLILVGSFLLMFVLGNVLVPLIASVVLAFMIQGLIARLVRMGASHWLALAVAYGVFLVVFFGVLTLLLPLVWQQSTNLFQEAPAMMRKLQQALLVLPERSELFTEAQIKEWMGVITTKMGSAGQYLLSFSIAQLPNVVGLLINIILIPILVFFFLKDKRTILNWLSGFLPDRRPLLTVIWNEMNVQVANYVRGKAIEIVIVGSVSYVSFVVMGLNYPALLGLLVGLSVVIPYIGAAVVTIPVLLVGYLQWGWGGEFLTLAIVYGVIQALDGNVLVPLLFSEAVNMHPVAIIVAVLVFGGLWGLWGVFFAIPLATLVKAILYAWPTRDRLPDVSTAETSHD